MAIELADSDRALLSGVPVFTGLPDDAITTLIAGARVTQEPRGTVLFVQEDSASHFYVILDGWVKVFRQGADGSETVIHVFSRGESFAEAVIFESGDYPASAEVVEEARLLAVPARGFVRALLDHPEWFLTILAAMARRMRFLVQQMEQRNAASTTERLGRLLLQMCPKGSGPAVVRLPTDKSLIAARLGMQPETLSRAFARLRKIGIVTHGGEVRIEDRAALRQLLAARDG